MIQDTRYGMRDARCGIRDAGCVIRDAGYEINEIIIFISHMSILQPVLLPISVILILFE